MFLDLDRVRILAVCAGSEFIKNIFICVSKMNEGLTGLDDMGVSNQWQKWDFSVNSKAARNNIQHDQCGLIHKQMTLMKNVYQYSDM